MPCNNKPHVYDFTLQHADSEGTLLGDRSSLQPASSVSTLSPCLDEPQGERPGVEDLRNSLERLNAADIDSSPREGEVGLQQENAIEEGESFKEDVLMGDDQVADFASSVLAAISCWHFRARALLSTHFTTVRVLPPTGRPFPAPSQWLTKTNTSLCLPHWLSSSIPLIPPL